MKTGADWLAWALQFIAGLLVGLLFGLAILGSRRGSRSYWLEQEFVPLFLAGSAFVGAGLASWHGDRLWLRRSYRLVRPDGVMHSRASRTASLMTAVAGGLLVVRAIFHHFAS